MSDKDPKAISAAEPFDGALRQAQEAPQDVLKALAAAYQNAKPPKGTRKACGCGCNNERKMNDE